MNQSEKIPPNPPLAKGGAFAEKIPLLPPLEKRGPEENRALIPFSDNLPYDRNRIIQEAKFCLQVEISARFEVGKRLLLLREHEGVQTFGHILEENFAGLRRTSAYNYMLFARKAADLPKFSAWANSGGNWAKALALLEACEEDVLAGFEEGGDILGLKTDEIERLSVRQLQKALRLALEKQEKAVAAAVAQTSRENAGLLEEVKDLKVQLTTAETPADKALAVITVASKKIMEGIQLLARVDKALLRDHEVVRGVFMAACDHGIHLLGGMDNQAVYAPMEGEE